MDSTAHRREHTATDGTRATDKGALRPRHEHGIDRFYRKNSNKSEFLSILGTVKKRVQP